MGDVLLNALSGLFDGGIEPLLGNRDLDLEYVDDSASLKDDAQKIQHALGTLTIDASRHGIRFAPSKFKVLLQDWQEICLH